VPPLRPMVRWAVRVAVGAILVAAAVPKLADPLGFAWAVARYDMAWVPVAAVAVYLPWLELFTGVAVCAAPPLRRGAFAVAAVLFGGFAAVGGWAVFGGLHIPCGCFSLAADAEPMGWGHVVGNVVCALVCAAQVPVRKEAGCPEKPA